MERGREVTIVGEAAKFGGGLLVVRRMRLLSELREHGVAMLPGASVADRQPIRSARLK